MKPSDMTPEQQLMQLNKLNKALGKLAPKGTWLCEQLEKIWNAKTEQEGVDIAIYVQKTIRSLKNGTVEHHLWGGDRVNSEGKVTK